MTTPSELAAERLISNAPHTSAAALGGNRDDLVWLLAAAYREGRFDAQGEELERHMRVLREQLREREVTPTVEFPLPTRLDREPVEIEHQSERSLERGFDLPGGLA